MTGDLVPSHHRISDLEREQAAEQLRGAVGAGRLTLDEFEHRIDAVYRAATRSDLVPLVADVVPHHAVRDQVEIRVTSGRARREGRWVSPRHLMVAVGSGSVKLDFTQALVPHPAVRIDLTVKSGSMTIVLPPGGTADVGDVEVTSGTVKSQVPGLPEAGGVHLQVAGSVRSGSAKIRYQRRFWRWRW